MPLPKRPVRITKPDGSEEIVESRREVCRLYAMAANNLLALLGHGKPITRGPLKGYTFSDAAPKSRKK